MPTGIYDRTKSKPNHGQFQKGQPCRNTGRTWFSKGHKVFGGFQEGNKVNLGKTGRRAGHWKGGRCKTSDGYIIILRPKHPFCNNDGYVREHRLVVEKQIGRYLHRWEVCHHIKEIKTDNRPEKLMAFVNEVVHKRFERGEEVQVGEIIFDGRKKRKDKK